MKNIFLVSSIAGEHFQVNPFGVDIKNPVFSLFNSWHIYAFISIALVWYFICKKRKDRKQAREFGFKLTIFVNGIIFSVMFLFLSLLFYRLTGINKNVMLFFSVATVGGCISGFIMAGRLNRNLKNIAEMKARATGEFKLTPEIAARQNLMFFLAMLIFLLLFTPPTYYALRSYSSYTIGIFTMIFLFTLGMNCAVIYPILLTVWQSEEDNKKINILFIIGMLMGVPLGLILFLPVVGLTMTAMYLSIIAAACLVMIF